jgi:predicted oxidoreductase
VSRLAAEYQVAPEAIVLAWLLRHPAQIQPVIGTSKVERLQAAVQAQHISLSRQHWYQLYIAARGAALP